MDQNNHRKPSQSLTTRFALGALHIGTSIYDLATLPLYTFVQMPWQHWKEKKWAALEDPTDPYSPLVRTQPLAQTQDLGAGQTLVEFFHNAVAKFGKKNLFGTREVLGVVMERHKDGKLFKRVTLGEYRWLSYVEADARIETIRRSLCQIGCRPRQPVLIFAETRVEWMLTVQAAFRISVPVVTLYATLGLSAIVHGINQAEVTHLITSETLLPKIKSILDQIPKITHIVYMEDSSTPDISGFPEHVKIIPFSEFEDLGADAALDQRLQVEPPSPDDVAIIMFTSGSTSVPKGVIISHQNLAQSLLNCRGMAPIMQDDTYIGYLPLSHVLELCGEALAACLGVPVGYSSPLTLTDSSTGLTKGCKGDFSVLKPTGMAAVPLILAKVRKGIMDVVRKKGEFAEAFFNFAIDYHTKWYLRGYNTPILDFLVFRGIRSMLGGRLRAIVVGGAPLAEDTDVFIRATLGVQVMQGYGMTESTGCATVQDYYNREFGNVGYPLHGCKIRLADWEEGGYRATDRPYPRGELLIGGSFVSMGYYKHPELTGDTYETTPDGIRWIKSGDIGVILPDGQVKVIDRKKDLVKLEMGEYVSYGKVESILNQFSLVENSCVHVAHQANHLVALVQPNRLQLQTLSQEVLGRDSLGMSTAELCGDPKVNLAAQNLFIQHFKKSGMDRWHIPIRYRLVTEEWTPDNGLVTAAFKIRRVQIIQAYQKDIDAMYKSIYD